MSNYTQVLTLDARQTDLDEFFQHKNHEYPPALSDYEKFRKPTAKSNLLKCLYQEKDHLVKKYQ